MSTEAPSFRDLFELWLQEKYQGYIKIATWIPDKDAFELVARVPNESYTQFGHIVVGGLKDNDVTVFTYGKEQYFNLPTLAQETRNAADPDFFDWFEKTLKSHHYKEMSRIESCL